VKEGGSNRWNEATPAPAQKRCLERGRFDLPLWWNNAVLKEKRLILCSNLGRFGSEAGWFRRETASW